MTIVRREEIEAKLVEPGLYGQKLVDGAHGSQGVSLVRGWLEPGARHSPHTHDVEEAVVFLSGHGVVDLGGRSHEVGPGDVVHIAPGVVHGTLNTGREDLCFVAAFADNLVSSNPLQNSGRGTGSDHRVGASWRNRLSWLLRTLANRLANRR